MKFAVFLKRSFKSPIFILSIIISLIFLYMYFNLRLSPSNSIKIGILLEGNDSETLDIDENGNELSYIRYKDEEKMKDDVKRGYINYGFVFDDEKEKVFTGYGKKDAFFYVIRENIYLFYFKDLAKKYTLNLLDISSEKYQKEYEKYKDKAFLTEFDKDSNSLIPIVEISSLLLFLSSLFVCYDYFSLNQKTAFFKSMKGRKMKGLFIISELLCVFLIYFLLLKITGQADIFKFVKYFILLYLNCILMTDIFNEKTFNLFMSFAFVFSLLAFSLFEMNVLKYVFLSNYLSYNRFSNEIFLIYISIYFLIILIARFSRRNYGFKRI